jgi:propanol-preferring alcohol dehydrogenase
VASVGAGVSDFRVGEPVAVFGAWGCGRCALCRAGDENLCNMAGWPGIGVNGGWAELMSVPSTRHLIRLGDLDPVAAAPLTDAGLTPYRAIRRALPHVPPGGTIAIIGVGGLGHLAIQIARAIGPAPRVIAIDVAKEKLETALALGADEAIEAGSDVGGRIRKITGGEGAHAVIDLVGSDASLATAAASVGRRGIVVLVGIAGGSLRFAFAGLPPECVLTTSAWGTRAELEALLSLAARGLVRARVETQPLERVNDALERLVAGSVDGRIVLTPNG